MINYNFSRHLAVGGVLATMIAAASVLCAPSKSVQIIAPSQDTDLSSALNPTPINEPAHNLAQDKTWSLKSLQDSLKQIHAILPNLPVQRKVSCMNLKTKLPMKFLPKFWNDNDCVQETNNCYTYAANRPYGPTERPFGSVVHPGNLSRPKNEVYPTCQSITRGAVLDHFRPISATKICRPNEHKVLAVVTSQIGDYHWYRQDDDGYWSHKPGLTEATNLDKSGHFITDPIKADRGAYSQICGFMCAPN